MHMIYVCLASSVHLDGRYYTALPRHYCGVGHKIRRPILLKRWLHLTLPFELKARQL